MTSLDNLKILKTCSKCKEIKNIKEFTRDSSRLDGLSYICKLCKNKPKKTKNPPKSSRELRLKSKYGLSLETFNKMLEIQNGLCAACGLPEKAKFKGKLRPLCVDHNHITGQIRSLLCLRCNLEVGILENKQRVKSIDYYLLKYKSK